MEITEELQEAWKEIKQPIGFVADIESMAEAEMELGNVENYFSGLNWQNVNPDSDAIRYMCPLLWMNDEAAKYYALSYLTYLLSPQANDTLYDTPFMTVQYFTDLESSILSQMTKQQQNLAQQAIDIFNKR